MCVFKWFIYIVQSPWPPCSLHQAASVPAAPRRPGRTTASTAAVRFDATAQFHENLSHCHPTSNSEDEKLAKNGEITIKHRDLLEAMMISKWLESSKWVIIQLYGASQGTYSPSPNSCHPGWSKHLSSKKHWNWAWHSYQLDDLYIILYNIRAVTAPNCICPLAMVDFKKWGPHFLAEAVEAEVF